MHEQQSDRQRTNCNTIPGEGGEPVSTDKPHEWPDHDEGGEEGGNETQRNDGTTVPAEVCPVPVEIVDGGAKHGWHGEEEGELRRGGAIHPKNPRAHDR